MVICVASDLAEQALQKLQELGETAWVVGRIETSPEQEPETVLQGL